MNPMNPLTPDTPQLPDTAYDDPRDPEIGFVPRPAVSAAALAAPPARVDPLNLARRPFLNSRPVVRASLLLWLLGALLLLGNVSLFWNYRQRSADKREQITRGEAEIANQQAASSKLQRQLDGFNLEAQNQKVDFLNKQIQERSFSWSELLDRLAARLPHDVRLNRLSPVTGQKAEKEFQRQHSERRATPRTSDQVPLSIVGETRNDEALLSFVDSLFKAPFSDPQWSREERLEGGKLTTFEISVQYRPGPAPAAAGDAAGTAPAPRIEELPMTTDAAPPAKPVTKTAPRPTLHPPPAPTAAPPQGGRP
ncbi:MAG TPA: hypothetical protein VGG20_02005 [Thermoanaerobaculia bacterium]|jgi:Tfp pilus assembly protein PilN